MNNKKKSLLVLVSLVLVLCFGAGGTLAWLSAKDGPITNEFKPTEITTEVEETIEGGVKKAVQIQNTGDTEAYIRAAVVITWQNEDGNVYGTKPVEGTDYRIAWNTTDWFEKDGFYYHREPVGFKPDENLTENLFTDCWPVSDEAPVGYNLAVEIIGSGIQSKPANVVQDNWGVTVGNDGNIKK